MSRVWFADRLETVATFWRVLRRDGVALGFVTHDRDLWLDGVLHRAAPGMVPSAIRRSAGIEADSAEVEGALTHDAIAASDVIRGRFDGAAIRIGLVDWESGESTLLYGGSIGAVTQAHGRFQAAVVSCKAVLHDDPVPRTSPTCRARFCGPGCGLSAARFTRRARVLAADAEANTVTLAGLDASGRFAADRFVGGQLRWLDGPLAGTGTAIHGAGETALALASPLEDAVPAGTAVLLREGCDRTLATCADRFGNAANFRGEPFLPGNDFVARTPLAP